MGAIQQILQDTRLRRAGAVGALGLFAVVLLVVMAGGAAVADSPTPQDAELGVKAYGFETGLSTSVWNVYDNDTSYGADYWAASTQRASAGNVSVWSAGVGNRDDVYQVLLDTSFENGMDGFQIRGSSDGVSNRGGDWGVSGNRAQSGSYSLYCAASLGGSSYVDNTDAWVVYPLPNGFHDGWLNYSYWFTAELNYDYWYEVWYDGSWHQQTTRNGYQQYWQNGVFQIPAGATKVGWYFHSDVSVTYEGIYIDDVTIEGVGPIANTVQRLYDDGMDARMDTSIDVSQYVTARMDYSYWLDAQSGDYLEVMYYTDMWIFADQHTGTSGGWRTSSISLPLNTIRIGFRFVSDGTGRAEGAYIDDIHITGTVLSPTCGAQISGFTGTERDTIFYFDGTGGGGWGNFTYQWTFGDGTNSSLRSPSHVYQDPGTYQARMTLTDSLGQTCTFDAAAITIAYDLREVVVGPVGSELIEGTSREFSAETRWGHQVDFDWRVDPANCGVFSVASGPRSTFTAGQDQGGYSCTIIATFQTGAGSVGVTVLHDVAEVVVTPPSATVFASQRVTMSAADIYGHPFSVQWWATCGRVLPDQGDATTFTAVATPGSTCVVTAEQGSARTTIPIYVQQDPSNMTVSPTNIHLVEGSGATFDAKDSFGKPLAVDWVVTPAACGELTLSHGVSTSLVSSTNAGGTSCRVTATVSGYSRNATVIVDHDLSGGTVALSAETVQGGEAVTATAADKYGHSLNVDWSVSPSTCGDVSPQSGPSTTLTTSTDLGEVVCTLNAHSATLTLLALVSIELGPPASIDVTFLGAAPEGGQTEARATVRDAGGHALDSSGVSWSTTCEGLSRTSGVTTLVTAPNSGAGTTCDVTATFGGVSGTGHLQITRGPAARLEISPSSISASNGERVTVSVKAWDQFDHELTPTTVIWAASCGHFEGEGTTVTYVAPDSGGPCQITATVPGGTVGVSAGSTVAVGSGLLLPIAIVAVVAVAAVAGFLLMRRNKPKAP